MKTKLALIGMVLTLLTVAGFAISPPQILPPAIMPGEVEAIRSGTVLYQLQQMLKYYPSLGYQVFGKEGTYQYVALWTDKSYWAWTAMDLSKQVADPSLLCGNAVCPDSARVFIQYLADNGFTKLPTLPPALIAFINALIQTAKTPVVFPLINDGSFDVLPTPYVE